MTELTERLRKVTRPIGEMAGDMLDAADEIEKLRAALQHYGGHKPHCNSRLPNRGSTCTCGWVTTSVSETGGNVMDIIERLRDHGDVWDAHFGETLCAEAADEIEALEAELIECRGVRDDMSRLVANQLVEIERLHETAHALAMEGLQSDLYRERPAFRDCVDNVLALTTPQPSTSVERTQTDE